MIRSWFFRMAWWLERRMLPGLRSSQYPYQERVQEALHPHSVWLDLGCGHQVFGVWMGEEQKKAIRSARWVVGIDLDFPGMLQHPDLRDRVMGRLESLPFPARQFDVVTANMVVEHLDQPAAVLREIRRVLKPSGVFVFHTPNYRSPVVYGLSCVPEWPKHQVVRILQGRKSEDIFETHYQLNRREDIERAAKEAGMNVEHIDLVHTSTMTVMLGPLAVFCELLFLRWLENPNRAKWRSNIVTVLSAPK